MMPCFDAKQRRHRQRAGPPICRADAQRGGHVSAAESQRPGVVDRVLRGAPRRLRRSFSADTRLKGQSHSRKPGCGPESPGRPIIGRAFSARSPRSPEFFWGGVRKSTCNLRTCHYIHGCGCYPQAAIIASLLLVHECRGRDKCFWRA